MAVSTEEDALAAGRAFFASLDAHMKSRRVQLADVFSSYDSNRSGQLDSRQQQRLVEAFMGTGSTEAQLRFCQVCVCCCGLSAAVRG